MTIRQLKQRDFARTAFFGGPVLAATINEPAPRSSGLPTARGEICHLPRRPDAAILSGSIPLFYIARNHNGFWVAREAEGRSGGIFLLRRSAVHFARDKTESAGCATMFVDGPLELDVANGGNGIVASLSAAMDIAAQRMPGLAAFAGMALTEWRKLVAEISHAIAGERRNRAAIEKELFHGQFRLSSKGDDDLPIAG